MGLLLSKNVCAKSDAVVKQNLNSSGGERILNSDGILDFTEKNLHSLSSLITNEGFVAPLDNLRFYEQASTAKQNLDSTPRISAGSEGPMGPQPGTPQGGVQRNPTTNDYYHVSHQIPYS